MACALRTFATVAIALSIINKVEAHCPDVWVRFQGSCYYFTHSHGMSFVESEHYCRQHESHLVHVNDATENAFLKEYISRLAGDTNYWMGLTDEVIEDVYRWIDTDIVANFTDWTPGQPDNVNGEDCAVFWRSQKNLWDDAHCSDMNEAVCEISMGDGELDIVG